MNSGKTIGGELETDEKENGAYNDAGSSSVHDRMRKQGTD